jgi:hypothetical protein
MSTQDPTNEAKWADSSSSERQAGVNELILNVSRGWDTRERHHHSYCDHDPCLPSHQRETGQAGLRFLPMEPWWRVRDDWPHGPGSPLHPPGSSAFEGPGQGQCWLNPVYLPRRMSSQLEALVAGQAGAAEMPSCHMLLTGGDSLGDSQRNQAQMSSICTNITIRKRKLMWEEIVF